MEEKAETVIAAVIAAFFVLVFAGVLLITVLCIMGVHDETKQAEQINRIEQYITERED